MLKEFKAILDAHHAKCMNDPIYVEGYNGPNHWEKPYPENPYPFDKETSLKLTRIAVIERHLTDEEKKELVRLRAIIENSEWDRWAKGNYRRWITEKA